MDKLDELAAVLMDPGRFIGVRPPGETLWQWQARAVRSFMGSEEVVERVARVLCMASISGGRPDDITLMEKPLWTEWEHDARAALSAAIGEDIGGGRG